MAISVCLNSRMLLGGWTHHAEIPGRGPVPAKINVTCDEWLNRYLWVAINHTYTLCCIIKLLEHFVFLYCLLVLKVHAELTYVIKSKKILKTTKSNTFLILDMYVFITFNMPFTSLDSPTQSFQSLGMNQYMSKPRSHPVLNQATITTCITYLERPLGTSFIFFTIVSAGF